MIEIPMSLIWRQLTCHLRGHDPQPHVEFSGGTTHRCRRCGREGTSFERCPSRLGDRTISWDAA